MGASVFEISLSLVAFHCALEVSSTFGTFSLTTRCDSEQFDFHTLARGFHEKRKGELIRQMSVVN
jgi:hypothetical protein